MYPRVRPFISYAPPSTSEFGRKKNNIDEDIYTYICMENKFERDISKSIYAQNYIATRRPVKISDGDGLGKHPNMYIYINTIYRLSLCINITYVVWYSLAFLLH